MTFQFSELLYLGISREEWLSHFLATVFVCCLWYSFPPDSIRCQAIISNALVEVWQWAHWEKSWAEEKIDPFPVPAPSDNALSAGNSVHIILLTIFLCLLTQFKRIELFFLFVIQFLESSDLTDRYLMSTDDNILFKIIRCYFLFKSYAMLLKIWIPPFTKSILSRFTADRTKMYLILWFCRSELYLETLAFLCKN